MLRKLTENENKVNYKNLSYKILLSDGKFHEFNFFKKYGPLFSLLEDLVTRKMIVNNANADQKSFVIDLMHGYDGSKLLDTEAIKTVLTKAKKNFLDAKKIQRKG